jgi:hypothetical protein
MTTDGWIMEMNGENMPSSDYWDRKTARRLNYPQYDLSKPFDSQSELFYEWLLAELT